MKDNAPDDTVIDRLRFALETAALPKAARDHAQHLLDRLASPVRVTVLGMPGSGKSSLLNMFVGQRLLPEGLRLPTLELTYGASERMTVMDTDGGKTVVDRLDFDLAAAPKSGFCRIELPHPILQRISLLEVVTDGSAPKLKAAIDWAVRRTDIALWCAQEFGKVERAVWERVPDSLKDHAFLVLTKADLLSSKNALTGRISDLETIVAEEFHSLFAVATLQAIKAHGAGGRLDEAVYHASGGGALKAEILRHAERGRRADFDSADLFLARYQVRDIVPSRKTTAPTPRPISVIPESSRPKAAPAPAPAAVSGPQVENVALFSDAVRFLRRRGEGLSEAAEAMQPGATSGLIDQCVDAVEHLVGLFSNDDAGCPAAEAFIDELMEASDLMVLMQAESGDAPAADAVTLLLQLRHDMEMKLAA